MKEYIERAMAFAVLVDFPGELSPENIGLAVARKAIDALPAADVAEVRHGRWNPEICESISKRNRLIEYKVYSCSLCGRSNGRIKKKYCPNCGALMKEDEHEVD